MNAKITRPLFLCAVAVLVWTAPKRGDAAVGYPPTTVQLGANTTVLPDSPPQPNTTSINVSVPSTNFKGLLEGNPATGIVRVTNAHPAGSHFVIVTSFHGDTVISTKFFLLTVTTPACSRSDQVTFTRKNFAAGINPISVLIGDYNNDGIQDLAVGARGDFPSAPGQIFILLGTGTGSFGLQSVPFYSFSSSRLAVADFNGDGLQDLAAVFTEEFFATVFFGLPAAPGTFDSFENIPTNTLPRSVSAGDFNDDFKPDMAVASEGSSLVSIFPGDGAASFHNFRRFAVAGSPFWIAVGDFEPNNRQDLAVTIRAVNNSTPGNVTTLLANATGGFSATPYEVPGDPVSVAVGDFNGDGKQDLATANQPLNGVPSGNVSVLLNDGSGAFGLPLNFSVGSASSPQSVAVGQFDANASQDLVVANRGSNTVSILLNKGENPLAFRARKFFVGASPVAVAVGDFNGDGLQDLAVANFDSNNVSILLQRGCPCGASFPENFDAVVAPDLPTGWVATNITGSAPQWVTSATAPYTVPNDAFVDDAATISDKCLDSPGTLITSATTRLCFRNNFNTEYDPPPAEVFWDGGVLEVSSPNINGGAFTDIIDAGGVFVSGPYTGEIDGRANNPLAGRPAWSGNSGGYILTVIDLPAIFNGQTIKLRFRMGTDQLVGAPGWRIDTIKIASVASGCCGRLGWMRLRNVSTRLLVQTGDNLGIGGFIITGIAPKHVLIRAIGPSLAQFGVPTALADPVLELHGPDTFGAITNDNWRDTQEAEVQATGIPPTNDFESAIDITLDPGAYTALVRGNGNSSGVALIEVYDVDQEGDAQLANISTRAFVGTGDGIVIAGVILGDDDGADDWIVVRGIGASLTAFGVPNALADPTLELRDNNGALLISNNDWQENPEQAKELTALGLAPINSLESGIAGRMPPGLYTALLAGLNNGTGVGLVEVYDVAGP